ncbi:RNA-directed DNA polymerase, eukaryota [Tanacetum coccineum]
MAARNRSNSDYTRLISKSIFVTNFPDNTSAKDLWEVCKGYGTVVDVFIPNRKSRSGKRFAFVRFIKVGNVDRLVENLCTLWIGRMHLHANVVRYDRPPISSSRPNVAPRPTVKSVSRPSANGASSFVSVLKGNPNTINHISTSPAMVLDDECLVERDLDNFVLGEVKDFSSINNLLILLSNEGFQHVRLVYLGGLWVMIELPSIETKTRFMKHVGVASWFSQLRTAQSDFVSRERIVWIDIEGVPLHAWSRPTFSKIGSRWGEVLELEDNKDDCFARKRICIKTKQEDNILEKFKIIVRGKIFVVRAKELFVWSPSFKGVNDAEFVSDDDSVNGEEEKNDDMSKKVNLEDESDIEGVSETVFGDQDDPLVQELNQNSLPNEKEISSDPFNLYNLINKRDKGEENTGLDSSLPFPPGFTPADQVKSDRKNSPLHSHSGGLNSRVLEESQPTKDQGSPKDNLNQRVGGSILEVIDDMIKVGQAMGFTMEGSLGSKAKKDWIKELNNKHKVNFLSIQETKSDHISDMDIKSLWGNSKFDCTISESVGNSGGILCVWDPSVFCKENHIISDNFIALYGSWVSKKVKLLMISIYAPQSSASKRILWNYISNLIGCWDGHYMVMGDFNEVRCVEDRFGSEFNAQSANEFNCFISNSGLIEIQLEGYSFTWSLQSAKKMSKLDRFLVSDGLLSVFPHLSGICLDRHLSDHRPILLREVIFDYGPSPFRVYHSWLNFQDFDKMVLETWNNIDIDDRNKMVRFKKKLQILKKKIRLWVNDYRKKQSGHLEELRSNLRDIDKELDQGGTNEVILQRRLEILKNLHDINSANARDYMQKAKIQWAIEGDENSKFFHGIINRKRANLAIKGVMVDGDWVDDPCRVKEEFRLHFANRFRAPVDTRYKLNYTFPNKLQPDQMATLESPVSRDEVRNAVWGCGENKSPGPDGFSFEFFRKFWDTVGSDFYEAVEWFFEHSSFSRGCNSSFIALIPKNQDPKFVNDYRPISLIGSLYKVVTKILANRLSSVIPGLISDVQTAFLPNRQILDGPFIINELLSWCKHKKQQAMVFKVDFAKAYDSIRWDFLEDVLTAFGFGPKWCSWIRGCLHSGMASVLLNGSPSSEFQFYCGLKQGDPLAPYLFLLVMESLHLSVSRAIEAGIFKGIKIDSTLNLSHLFYADTYNKTGLGPCKIHETEMKQLMTAEFCPIEEIQRMEHDLWNLKIKEYDIVAYTQRFNELALTCPRMIELERVKWENLQGGNSSGKGNQKDNSRQTLQNNQKQGNARAMVTAPTDGKLPLCERCFTRHVGQCTIKCHNVGRLDIRQGHTRNRCPKKVKQEEVGEVRGRAYAIKDAELKGPGDGRYGFRPESIKSVWAIVGDENANEESFYRIHYEARFNKPTKARLKLSFSFPNRLSTDQVADLERHVSHDEIRLAVWDCGVNKSWMVLSFLNEVLIGVKGEEEECVVFYVDFAKAYKLGFVGTSCLTSLRLLDFGSDLVSLGLEVALLMENKFRYLGVMVGAGMTRHKAWDDVVLKLQSRLSKWKAKTLSIGGRLTLLKSVLGASPLYNMSSFKVPKGVLKVMESKFVRGEFSVKDTRLAIDDLVLPSHSEPTRWVKLIPIKINVFMWRARRGCLPTRYNLVQKGGFASCFAELVGVVNFPALGSFSNGTSGISIRLRCRLVSHCRIHVGNGLRTNFWKEVWIGDNPLCVLFPRIFALETNKDSLVAVKLSSVTSSLRRPVRGGSESSQLSLLQEYIEGTILSSLEDMWVWDLNGEGGSFVFKGRLRKSS